VGLLFCFSTILFTLMPKAYRRSHLAHHRFGNLPGDPDPQLQGMENMRRPSDIVVFLARGTSLPIRYFLAVFWNRPWWQRVASLALVGLLVWTAPALARLVAMYWIVPLLTFYSLFEFIRLNAEHNGVDSDLPLYRTRTVIPSLLSRLTIAPAYVGYHLAHHVYPGVPFFRRHEMHELLMESNQEYRDNAHITRGYGRMLLELVRYRGGPLIRSAEPGARAEGRA
jgi:fatty acid desaturase